MLEFNIFFYSTNLFKIISWICKKFKNIPENHFIIKKLYEFLYSYQSDDNLRKCSGVVVLGIFL